MAFTNSPLAVCTALSPNYTKGRNGKTIDTITLHVYVGQIGLAQAKASFMDPKRGASSNYVITKDGEIVLKVEEKNRSWCTGGAGKKGIYYPVLGTTLNETGSSNDYHAVTVEIASDTKAPYRITDKALQAAIKLCADIAKRNNMGELKFLDSPKLIGHPDKQNMTMHRWFDVNKKGYLRSCPGDYLKGKLAFIAAEANKINSGGSPTPTPTPTPSGLPDENTIILGKYFYTSPADKAKVDMGYVFNPVYYANHWGDLKAAFGYDDKKLFEHFCNYGMFEGKEKEGRQANAIFNPVVYRKNYPALIKEYGTKVSDNPKYYEHFCRFGYNESRKAT